MAAAAAAARAAARAAGSSGNEAKAAGEAVVAGQMSPHLLPGAAAELGQAFADSPAGKPSTFATRMLAPGPERQLLLRLQRREAAHAVALQAALRLPRALAPFFCDHELRQKSSGTGSGRLRSWCMNTYM